MANSMLAIQPQADTTVGRSQKVALELVPYHNANVEDLIMSLKVADVFCPINACGLWVQRIPHEV